VNLTGYADPILTFATQRTGTGFNSNQVAYSTDNTTFTNFLSPYNAPTSFALQTFDFSSINVLDGAATAYFRITLNGATSGAGNNRFDNIQINATVNSTTAVPEPSTVPALLLLGLGISGRAAFAVRRRREVAKLN